MSELPPFLENKNKLESHKRVCENKDFCNVIMGSDDSKILEFNQYKNSDKAPFFYLGKSWVDNRKDWSMKK